MKEIRRNTLNVTGKYQISRNPLYRDSLKFLHNK